MDLLSVVEEVVVSTADGTRVLDELPNDVSVFPD